MKYPKELTHFLCNSCDKVKTIKQRNVVKAAYTAFDRDSYKKFSCFYYHIQLCDKCLKESEK